MPHQSLSEHPGVDGYCEVCPVFQDTFCGCLLQSAAQFLAPALGQKPVMQTIGARRLILRQGELADGIPVICEGWAASWTIAPNGRRQILSILLSGDVVSSALLFGPASPSSVEAITDVRCQNLPRDAFRSALRANPGLVWRLSHVWVSELAQKERLIVELGQMSAEQRMARLILDLFSRLSDRGSVRDQVMEFPLRHHHVADLIGVSPTHVSNILSDFRQDGTIQIADRSLVIRDMSRLRRAAEVR